MEIFKVGDRAYSGEDFISVTAASGGKAGNLCQPAGKEGQGSD